MTLFQQLSDEKTWENYLQYKVQCGNLNSDDEEDLLQFIAKEEYLPVVERMGKCEFPLPKKMLVSKMGSDRKRVVYTYPREENYVLKLITFLLLRQYEHTFAPNLYSFRVKHGVNEAIKYLHRDHDLASRYVYKVDVHDYFNSVDVDIIIPQLQQMLGDEPEILAFVISILRNPKVLLADGSVVEEQKGIMAGIPLSAFLANVYLSDMDWKFYNEGKRYMRYSDDIIIFCDSADDREEAARTLLGFLADRHLEVNPKKEMRAAPGEEWTFLGVKYCEGLFDISDASIRKICDKMRRKYRSLIRWRKRNGLAPDKAASAFIKKFNHKLYENDLRSDLTWSRWFFPIINTTKGLHRIDNYMQQCVRYIMTEKRTKRAYDCNYADIKALGYRCLVNEYYKAKENYKTKENRDSSLS